MSSSDTTEAPGAEAPESDEAREALLAGLTEELGDAVVGSEIQPGVGLWVRVTADAWATTGYLARDRFDFRWFDFVSAIDWLPSPFGRYEDDGFGEAKVPDTEIVTGVSGGDTRFQLLARVVDVVAKTDLILKADVPDDTLTVPTWVPVYRGADWHEREAWEMFGITFEGHPGLRHMYLPGHFEGNPLRKDFPLLARVVKPWPGVVDVEPMPAEPEDPEDGDAEAPAGASATEGDAASEEAAPAEGAAPSDAIAAPDAPADEGQAAGHAAEAPAGADVTAPAGAASEGDPRVGEAGGGGAEADVTAPAGAASEGDPRVGEAGGGGAEADVTAPGDEGKET